MNYHIMIQDKFINGFISDIYEIGQEKNNTFWIRSDLNKSNGNNSQSTIKYIGDSIENLKRELKTLKQDDCIFVHWYDSSIADLLLNLPNKLFVFFWGGEMYQEPYWHHFHWLFDKYTSKYLKRISAPKIEFNTSFLSSLINRISYIISLPKDKKEYAIRLKQIQRIDFLTCSELNIGEVKLVRKLYPNSKFTFVPAFYNVNFNLSEKITKTEDYIPQNRKMKILLGNSSTPTNNHIDSFKLLSNKGLDIYCPLSYGNSGYRNYILNEGFNYFENCFNPIFNFMERKSYCDFINSMDIVFMFHNRSQAWGNIVIALTLGKPVFIKRKNPLWDFIHELGVVCYDAEKIGEYNLLQILKLENSKRQENLSKLRLHLSKEKRLKDLKNLLRNS